MCAAGWNGIEIPVQTTPAFSIGVATDICLLVAHYSSEVFELALRLAVDQSIWINSFEALLIVSGPWVVVPVNSSA